MLSPPFLPIRPFRSVRSVPLPSTPADAVRSDPAPSTPLLPLLGRGLLLNLAHGRKHRRQFLEHVILRPEVVHVFDSVGQQCGALLGV